MGNLISNQTTITKKRINSHFENTLDFIASHHILTMDTQNLRKMYDIDYCNKMVVLTSDIINKYFNDYEITGISRRIDNNKIVFFDKLNIPQLDISDPDKKLEICTQIAQFYIKIAHVFSAIVMTINPEYIYKDIFGNYIKKNLYEESKNKDALPPLNSKVVKMGLCANRVDALKSALYGNKNNLIELNTTNSRKSSLIDEPGMPELMDLYYDEYNIYTGQFDKMSDKTKKKFHADLKKFYIQFTGNHDIPDSIKKFSDITMHVRHSTSAFKSKNKDFSNSNSNSKKDLMLLYAENLKQMVQSITAKQQLMLNILNKLFVYSPSLESKSELVERNTETTTEVSIHPDLTMKSLQNIIVETRNLISDLYLKCEDDYLEGMKIYEAIVESQILHTSQNQIESLQKLTEKLLTK